MAIRRYTGPTLDGAQRSLIAGGEPRAADRTGVKALMVAVLEDGLTTYLAGPGRTREEAESWLMEDRSEFLFSFPVICETLGLDAAAVRASARQLRREGLRLQRDARRSAPGTNGARGVRHGEFDYHGANGRHG